MNTKFHFTMFDLISKIMLSLFLTTTAIDVHADINKNIIQRELRFISVDKNVVKNQGKTYKNIRLEYPHFNLGNNINYIDIVINYHVIPDSANYRSVQDALYSVTFSKMNHYLQMKDVKRYKQNLEWLAKVFRTNLYQDMETLNQNWNKGVIEYHSNNPVTVTISPSKIDPMKILK